MAATLIQTTGKQTKNDVGTAQTTNTGTPFSAGNVVILSAVSYNVPIASVTLGGIAATRRCLNTVGNNSAEIWYAVMTGTPTDAVVVTPGGSSNYLNYSAEEWSGLDVSSPPGSLLDVQVQNETGNSTSPTATSGTLAVPDELLYAVFYAQVPGGGATITNPAGWTASFNDPDGSTTQPGAAAYRTVNSTSSVAAVWTIPSSLAWLSALASFRLVTGGPTIDVQPTGSHVPVGATASFSVSAVASGGGVLSYQWKVGGVDISGAVSDSYTTDALNLGDDGNSYTCAVTETGGTSPGTTTSSAAVVRVGLIYVGASTPVFSTSGGGTVSPSYSTLPAISSGDIILLFVGQKPSSANNGSVTTPTGFTLQESLTGAGGYGATLGADTGNTNLFAYSKNTVSGSETGTLSVTVGTNNVCWGVFVLLRPPPGSVGPSYGASDGSDTTAGNVSIACATNPGIEAGDQVVFAMCTPTDAATFSAYAITATGVTFGTAANIAQPISNVGNDIGGFIGVARANSGSSSSVPTFTATTGGTTTNARGPGVLVRTRISASLDIPMPAVLSFAMPF